MTDIQTQVFFDLTREGWLPCLDHGGKPLKQLLSLRQIFAQAHELADINGDSPLVDAALYRLLLVILHRNFQNTQTRRWQELWDEQKFDMQTLNAYFDEWQDQKERFFLFHPISPFYQSPKAYGGGENGASFDKGVADLILEIASGDNQTLFNHTVYHKEMDEGNYSISLPTAARMLLAIQSYKLSGTGAKTDKGEKANFESGPLIGGIVFLTKGKSLFETLMLNLIEVVNGDPLIQKLGDCPSWEQDDPFSVRTIPYGYLDYLTWQSCKILLEPPVQTESGFIVRKLKMSLGLTKLDSDARKCDPMKAFEADGEGRPTKAIKWKLDRSLWRDSAALFNLHRTQAQRSDKAKVNLLPPRIFESMAELLTSLDRKDRTLARYRCVALGMLNDQASIDFYRREEMPLPADYLTNPHLVEKLDQSLKQTDRIAEILGGAAEELLNFLIEIKPNQDGGDIEKRRRAMRSWVEQHYWPNLTQPFYEFMDRLRNATDLDAQLTEWREQVSQIAQRALEEVSNGLGDSAKAYKARIRAKQEFDKGIYKLKPKETKQ